MYKHIYGNCVKKEYDFQEVVEECFAGDNMLEFLEMIQNQDVSVANAKDIMQRVIDGDENSPLEIAKQLGYLGGAIDDKELEMICIQVLNDDKSIVQKIKNTGNMGPLQALVGNVMKRTHRKGDPKKI